jgi:anthranilate synthase component 1
MPDERYREIVRTMKEHIAAGDIYQAVPSRRVTFASTRGGMPIYRRLRVANPAPYMFFVRMLGVELAGSSPEPLVRVENRNVTTRPIAGTRPRGET